MKKDDSITVINKIPYKACPHCGKMEFIVSEIQNNIYLTNRDGEIETANESDYNAEGICLNCNEIYKMTAVHDGFIPMTPLRLFMQRHLEVKHEDEDVITIVNPMYKG